MRSTWPGARSSRIRTVTGPLEVSRRSVLSRSTSGFWVMGGFGFLFLAGFYDRDHEGASRNGVAELLGDSHRHGFGSPGGAGAAASSGRSPAPRSRVSLMATTKGRPAMAPPNLSVIGNGMQRLSISSAAA